MECVKHNLNKLLELFNNIYNNKYLYDLSNYSNIHSMIKITCPEHGLFEIKASSHLYSLSHCPNCEDFKYLIIVSKFLNKNNIKYKSQYYFNNLDLPFDFYIPSIRTCIEYIKEDSSNDRIKEDYCEDNYINLIRIKYDVIDIENFLYNNLKPIINI